MENKILGGCSFDEMKLEDYKAIYEAIVSLSCDADGFGLCDGITAEDIEKCKWIAAIYDVVNEAVEKYVNPIFSEMDIQHDWEEFYETHIW